MFSILKYEERWSGDYRQLMVKNITDKDLCEYSVEAKGEKSSAKLSKQSPWVGKIENSEGPIGGIGLIEVMVMPATQVAWYIGNQKITRDKFR